jgi:hypothetical protein
MDRRFKLCRKYPSEAQSADSDAPRWRVTPSANSRYDIHEDDEFDEAQFAARVKQASQLPGERM